MSKHAIKFDIEWENPDDPEHSDHVDDVRDGIADAILEYISNRGDIDSGTVYLRMTITDIFLPEGFVKVLKAMDDPENYVEVDIARLP